MYSNVHLVVLLTICASGIKNVKGTCLVFKEKFKRDLQRNRKWDHEVSLWGGGNNEFQAYLPDPENSYTQNGILHIKPTLLEDKTNTGRDMNGDFQDWLSTATYDLNSTYGTCTRKPCIRHNFDIPPIASARLHTLNTFTFKYGRVEVFAKMPKGDWLWPAVWLLPPDTSNYPYAGEMDMMEGRGNLIYYDPENNATRAVDSVSSALHVCSSYKKPHYDYSEKTDGGNWADDFYNFTLDWRPSSITFYADGVEVFGHNLQEDGSFQHFCHDTAGCGWDVPNELPPFDKEFYLIINLAIGGMTGYWHPLLQPTNPWAGATTRAEALQMFYAAKDQWLPTWGDTLQIKSVKVYQETGWKFTRNGNSRTACQKRKG